MGIRKHCAKLSDATRDVRQSLYGFKGSEACSVSTRHRKDKELARVCWSPQGEVSTAVCDIYDTVQL